MEADLTARAVSAQNIFFGDGLELIPADRFRRSMLLRVSDLIRPVGGPIVEQLGLLLRIR
jgi:hypothetical protein